MLRTAGRARREDRASALWGTGGRGGDGRSNALWGRRHRLPLLGTLVVAVLALPLAAAAGGSSGGSGSSGQAPTYVAPGVYQAAEANADGTIHVIIQSSAGPAEAEDAYDDANDEAGDAAEDSDKASAKAAKAAKALRDAEKAAGRAPKADRARANREVKRAADDAAKAAAEARQAAWRSQRLGGKKFRALTARLRLIGAVAAEIPSQWVALLANEPGLTVTLDAEVKKSALPTSKQLWVHQSGAAKLWESLLLLPDRSAPSIAIVDSGIDTTTPSFAGTGRVLRREVFTTLPQASTADGRGHGTFVAGIAAGSAPSYAGVAPNANLIDLDVMDDRGMARTSDVISAAEWIVKHEGDYNIRVANFSLHSAAVLSIKHHPLNKAVQKLWFAGVVVVVAAGNYGIPDGPSGVKHAPGNDPFVITVGAYDLDGEMSIRDHDVPTWSAYGFTNEGFSKPDVVAPGRSMVSYAPLATTLASEKPSRVVKPGLLKLSGTSFASPVVAGMAALILDRNPSWTPDMVKGALMTTSRYIPEESRLKQGRGEVNAVRAVGVRTPPNPNLALNQFVVADPAGGSIPVFDAAAWANAAWNNTTWDDAAWNSAAWSSAAFDVAAWSSAAWSDAAWNDAAWANNLWFDDESYEDNAETAVPGEEQLFDEADAAAAASDPELALP
jgi:serine protease AprX